MDIYLVYILAEAFVARNVAVAVIEVLYKSGIGLLIGNYLFTVEVSCLFKQGKQFIQYISIIFKMPVSGFPSFKKREAIHVN